MALRIKEMYQNEVYKMEALIAHIEKVANYNRDKIRPAHQDDFYQGKERALRELLKHIDKIQSGE